MEHKIIRTIYFSATQAILVLSYTITDTEVSKRRTSMRCVNLKKNKFFLKEICPFPEFDNYTDVYCFPLTWKFLGALLF